MPRSNRLLLLRALLSVCLAGSLDAGAITFSGRITQSTFDGTGPAGNNPGLNNIQDGQAYAVTLNFAASITAPGTYTPTIAAFAVPLAGASETSFGLLSLTITLNGSFDDFSFLGCLTTGTDCPSGNQLDANFRISSASLTSQNVAATGLDQPHPLDLLEDDGLTDIHGSIDLFSNTGSSAAVPEPGQAVLSGVVLVFLGAAKWHRGSINQERKSQ